MKDEAFGAYKDFVAWVKTQHSVQIKQLHSDQGSEYTSLAFTEFLHNQGTEHHLTTHNTPQHNGVIESLNRRILEQTRTMLHQSQMPKSLWGEAVNWAIWLKNRTSTQVLSHMTPFEQLMKEKLNLAHVPIWGQQVWVHNDSGSKLDECMNDRFWVGYDNDSPHAHRIYWKGCNKISVK
jgi:transposase InsO family protein